jgi:PAS domain-containing protein
MQEPPKTRSLVLILTKDLASRLATPVMLVDAEGMLVYFNEAAEPILGTTYSDSGFRSPSEVAKTFEPRDDEGNLIPIQDLPLTIAIVERRPAHGNLSIQAGDGVKRHLAATAFPLIAHTDDVVGAVAVFWERDGTDL